MKKSGFPKKIHFFKRDSLFCPNKPLDCGLTLLNRSDSFLYYQGDKSVPSKQMLQKEIDTLPEELAEEVYDFVNFLKSKRIKEVMEITILSESSLLKDWLCVEEDEVWQNL